MIVSRQPRDGHARQLSEYMCCRALMGLHADERADIYSCVCIRFCSVKCFMILLAHPYLLLQAGRRVLGACHHRGPPTRPAS